MSRALKNVKDVFLVALDAAPADRAALLDVECAGNAALRRQVEALLQVHNEPDSLLDKPRIGLGIGDADFRGSTIDQTAADHVGALIGAYKLREQIGEGGMGVVYVAEQTDPVRRKVALKIIKPGMGSREVVARFEAERQALALMDHPHIARIFDGGATEAGQPYFVMELVQGLPITEYCDQRRLDMHHRLELFQRVCRAVHHAHQKGVIHRDLKPSNVLVPEIDGAAVPKVIDFGVAKAVSQKLTEHTVYTQFSQLVGTPLYMSPEQAELGVVDVDTRSDVYSLGVLLYELLTGDTPFDNKTFRRAGFDEMRRMIREVDPLRPSQRVSTLDAAAASTVSESRGIDQRRLHRTLRGDLDWIVMKALEKDRNRRYESASALAADVQRYLDGEPIEARQPRLFAGARKWCRRHRTATTASAVAAILLLMVGAALAADRHRLNREATSFVQHSFDAAREALASGNVDISLQRLAEAQARMDASDITDSVLIENVAAFQNEATRYGKLIQLCEVGRQHQDETEPWIPAVNEGLALYDVMNNASWLAVLRKSALPEAHVARVSDRVYELLLQKADDLIRWASKWPEEGRHQRLEKQCQEALVCLEKAVSFHAPSRGYYWLLANCAQIQHEKDRETDLRKTALATPPHSAAELFYINRDHLWGSVSHYTGYPQYPFEQNYKDHREMLRFDPTYFNGLHYMGLRLNAEGRYQEALVAWYGCLALRPGDYFTLCFRSRTHLRLEQYDEALLDANTVIKQAPDVIDGWTLRGLSYAGLNQFDKAAEDLAKAVEVEKSIGFFGLESPLKALAWILATSPDENVRDGERAVDLATKACELSEQKNAETIDTLAAAYAETGDFELAVTTAEKAIAIANDAQRPDLELHRDRFRSNKPWRREEEKKTGQ